MTPPSPKNGIKIWLFPVLRIVLFFVLMKLLEYGILYCEFTFFSDWTKSWVSEPSSLVPRIDNALAVVAAYVFMVAVVDRRDWSTSGLTPEGVGLETTVGFALGAVLISLVIGCTALLGAYHVAGQNAHADLFSSSIFLLLAAVSEEIAFRGYVFQTLEKSWGTFAAVMTGSILFGFYHMLGPSHVPMMERLCGCLCLIVESGLLYNGAYLLRRRLWLPIGMHWAWNYLQGPIYGLAVSGLVFWTPFFKATSVGPDLITGGKWGPEAGVPAFVIRTAFAIILLLMAYRSGEFLKAGAASNMRLRSSRSR